MNVRKLILAIIKYYPILMNFIICIIFGEYLFSDNYDISNFLKPIFGYSLLISLLFLLLSIDKRFCWWHRLLICNMVANNLMSMFDKCGVDVPIFFYILSVVSAISLVLSTFMIIKYGFTKKRKLRSYGV